MGYYSYFSGDLEIAPAIPLPAPSEVGHDGNPIYFGYFTLDVKDGDEDVQIVDGQITVVGKEPGTIVVGQYYDETIKGYDYSEQLGALVDWAKANGGIVNGIISCDGEESTDFSRFRIENNTIHGETPRFLWPNGDIESI